MRRARLRSLLDAASPSAGRRAPELTVHHLVTATRAARGQVTGSISGQRLRNRSKRATAKLLGFEERTLQVVPAVDERPEVGRGILPLVLARLGTHATRDARVRHHGLGQGPVVGSPGRGDRDVVPVVGQGQHDAVEVTKDVGPGKMKEDAHARVARCFRYSATSAGLTGAGSPPREARERLDRVGDDRSDGNVEPVRPHESLHEYARSCSDRHVRPGQRPAGHGARRSHRPARRARRARAAGSGSAAFPAVPSRCGSTMVKTGRPTMAASISALVLSPTIAAL